MIQATIGDRYQVVIPREIRRQVNLKPRSKVTVMAQGQTIVIVPSGGVQALYGLGRDLADGTDATDYVRQLREEWGQRP